MLRGAGQIGTKTFPLTHAGRRSDSPRRKLVLISRAVQSHEQQQRARELAEGFPSVPSLSDQFRAPPPPPRRHSMPHLQGPGAAFRSPTPPPRLAFPALQSYGAEHVLQGSGKSDRLGNAAGHALQSVLPSLGLSLPGRSDPRLADSIRGRTPLSSSYSDGSWSNSASHERPQPPQQPQRGKVPPPPLRDPPAWMIGGALPPSIRATSLTTSPARPPRRLQAISSQESGQPSQRDTQRDYHTPHGTEAHDDDTSRASSASSSTDLELDGLYTTPRRKPPIGPSHSE